MKYFIHIFVAIFLVCFNSVYAQITSVANGAFQVQSAEYKFPAAIIPEIRTDMETELWAKVFWPSLNQSTTEKLPLIYFLHGNTGTCGIGNNPIDVQGCEYTTTGKCSNGSQVILNHEGYNYIAENLASHGYIVVTINANRGITCASGPIGDYGANLVRGRLVLKHLEQWQKWNDGEAVPSTLSQNPQEFMNRIDFQNVGLMGHSRGGEGVRAAYAQYLDKGSDWAKKIPGLKIEGIFEIGAVDGQSNRVLDADTTHWNQLLPACDGDVSDLQGSKPYFRMLNKNPQTMSGKKSLTLVYGTNHNFYNTVWQDSDASEYSCHKHKPIWTSTPWKDITQPQISSFLMNHFFLSHVGDHKISKLAETFDSKNPLPPTLLDITRIDRDTTDFDLLPSSTTLDNFTTENNQADVKAAWREAFGSTVVMKKIGNALTVSWQQKSEDNLVSVRIPKGKNNFTKHQSLNIRLSLGSCSAVYSNPLLMSIELVDQKNNTSAAINLTDYLLLDQNGTCSISFYQSVRIPMMAFSNGLIQMNHIAKINFKLNQSESGKVLLSTISLSNELPYNLIQALPQKINQPHQILSSENSDRTIYTTEQPVYTLNTEKNSARITLSSTKPFLPQDELLTLTLNNKIYKNARYVDYKNLKTIYFEVPLSEFQKMSSSLNSKIYVSYGELNKSKKIWIK